MKSLTKTLFLFCACSLLAGCLAMKSPFLPYVGSGFNGTEFPVDTEFDQTRITTQRGRAASYAVLFGLFAWGDCTVNTARRNGRIDVVTHIDGGLTQVILGLFAKYEIIVTGYSLEDTP